MPFTVNRKKPRLKPTLAPSMASQVHREDKSVKMEGAFARSRPNSKVADAA
jgi:hypothetical protein